MVFTVVRRQLSDVRRRTESPTPPVHDARPRRGWMGRRCRPAHRMKRPKNSWRLGQTIARPTCMGDVNILAGGLDVVRLRRRIFVGRRMRGITESSTPRRSRFDPSREVRHTTRAIPGCGRSRWYSPELTVAQLERERPSRFGQFWGAE